MVACTQHDTKQPLPDMGFEARETLGCILIEMRLIKVFNGPNSQLRKGEKTTKSNAEVALDPVP